MTACKKIIILASYFYPGYKAGGPIQSLKALVAMLGNQYDFRVITRDRDSGDSSSYPDVQSGAWKEVLGTQVCYTSTNGLGLFHIYRAIRQNADLDMYYINSFVDPIYSMFVQLLWHLRLIPRRPILIAARGEFTVMSFKKRIYFPFYKLFNLQKNVFFQALNLREMFGIQGHFSNKKEDKHIFVVPNVSLAGRQAVSRECIKSEGKARFVYVARIEPIKNLLAALAWLKQVKGEVQFDIYGLLQDKPYWQMCESELVNMPASINIKYEGAISHDQVMTHLARHEFCLHPSRNEGSSNSLIEALASGLPLIISDQAGLDLSSTNAGWSLPLSDEAGFVRALQQCVDMGDEEYQKMSASARALATQFTDVEAIAQRHAAMFDAVIASGEKK